MFIYTSLSLTSSGSELDPSCSYSTEVLGVIILSLHDEPVPPTPPPGVTHNIQGVTGEGGDTVRHIKVPVTLLIVRIQSIITLSTRDLVGRTRDQGDSRATGNTWYRHRG